ncbi:MAG: DUF1467 family protein, partial [Pseudomonadota bacterium]
MASRCCFCTQRISTAPWLSWSRSEMSFTSAAVLFAVIWAMVFYIINPLWQKSQSEDGHVVPGT